MSRRKTMLIKQESNEFQLDAFMCKPLRIATQVVNKINLLSKALLKSELNHFTVQLYRG